MWIICRVLYISSPQVSAVAVCGGEVYVGTTWGCVVVAEAESMRPITVFRPYEDEVRAIVPLPPTSVIVEPELGSGDVSDGSEGDAERLMNPVPLLATIGKGYRNLLGRYAPIPRSAQPEPGAQRAMYCLLWRAHHWLNTWVFSWEWYRILLILYLLITKKASF